MLKRLSGFTLVELMVAMAIIAVLLSLATFGISTLNRLSRDNQRRTTVDNIQRLIAAYYADNLSYPAASQIAKTSSTISITGYPYAGVPLTGPLKIDTSSDVDGTRYCYSLQSDGYVLGAKLESGAYFNVGEASAKCSDTTTSFYIAP